MNTVKRRNKKKNTIRKSPFFFCIIFHTYLRRSISRRLLFYTFVNFLVSLGLWVNLCAGLIFLSCLMLVSAQWYICRMYQIVAWNNAVFTISTGSSLCEISPFSCVTVTEICRMSSPSRNDFLKVWIDRSENVHLKSAITDTGFTHFYVLWSFKNALSLASTHERMGTIANGQVTTIYHVQQIKIVKAWKQSL